MRAPFFTIAIATYNRADFLRQCVASCLAQTYADLEVVVVDGASTDQSVELVKGMNDSRIRLIVQAHNQGISSGRHEAVVNSTGQWIIQLDSDHALKPHALTRLKERIDKGLDGSVGAVCARYTWDTGAVTPFFMPVEPLDYEARLKWVEEEGGTDCLFCARRDAILESNWVADRFGGFDALFHLDFSKRWREAYMEDELAIQYSTAGDSSQRGHRGRARALIRWAPGMAWQYEEILHKHGAALSRIAPNSYWSVVRSCGLHNFYAGNRAKGCRFLFRYVRRHPGELKYWAPLVVGAVHPRSVAKLNEWSHAIENASGITICFRPARSRTAQRGGLPEERR